MVNDLAKAAASRLTHWLTATVCQMWRDRLDVVTIFVLIRMRGDMRAEQTDAEFLTSEFARVYARHLNAVTAFVAPRSTCTTPARGSPLTDHTGLDPAEQQAVNKRALAAVNQDPRHSLVMLGQNRRERPRSREWANEAVRRIEADENRSADTHLHVFPLPEEWGIDVYLKDESVHPTGSLKHRLARSLFLYGLCNGWITERTTVVEASSGSTAVSEAYFARFLGLPFVAVMPTSTSPEKIALIEAQGGMCHLVEDPSTMVAEARRLAAERDGHFLDQFTYAERATDWRGNNNIAESIFSQIQLEQHPIPAWVVVGAGTGGTSATIGRYARLMRYATRLCVVDPEDSIFYPSWTGDPSTFTGRPSRIEGIGRQRVEPSFLPDIVDHMIQVPDAASIATMRFVREHLRRSVGGSTGTNVWGAFLLVGEMRSRGERGSIVTLICDGGDRYAGTYYCDDWVREQGLELGPYREALETFLECGCLTMPTMPR